MANSGVNTGFAKCFILFIAVIVLIQGCVYLGLSIWGLIISSCSNVVTNIEAQPFRFAIDVIYFIEQSCNNGTVGIAVSNQTFYLSVDWATSELITNRMEIFLILYVVISALWIITSLMVIGTICAPVTACVLTSCFLPWFLVVLAGSIFDAVATGFHINDIVHTTSAADTFKYVGLEMNNMVQTAIQNFDPYFITPALIMTCISSRVLLLWLLNIFGVSFCFSLSRVLAKQQTFKSRQVAIAARNLNDAAIPAQQTNNGTGAAAKPQQLFVTAEIEQYPTQIQPKPLPIQAAATQRPNAVAANRRSGESNPAPNQEYSASAPMANDNTNNVNMRNVAVVAAPTYRNSATHPDNLNYPTQALENTRAATPTQPVPTTPFRFVNAENPSFTPVAANPPQRVSAELRSQLPWSYTSMAAGANAGKPQPPRKPQVQIYPQIPEPDYAGNNNNNAQASQEGYTRW